VSGSILINSGVVPSTFAEAIVFSSSVTVLIETAIGATLVTPSILEIVSTSDTARLLLLKE
jgi:hypothetical protein